MGAPVAAGDLVADQRVARGVVGDAQQGFGQAHQRHAFLRGERELLHELVHAAALGARAQGFDQAAGQRGRFGAGRVWQRRLRQQRGDALLLGPAVGGGDRLAQRILFADGGSEIGKGRARGHGVNLWNGMR